MTPDPHGVDAITRIYQRLMAASLRDRKAQATLLGVRTVDVDALRLIAEGEPISPSQLIEPTAMSAGGMTALLDRLEAAGLTSRSRAGTGRRRVLITLTDAGRQVMAEEQQALAERISSVAPTDAQVEALRAAAQQLLNVVEDRAAALAAGAAERAQRSASRAVALRQIVRWG